VEHSGGWRGRSRGRSSSPSSRVGFCPRGVLESLCRSGSSQLTAALKEMAPSKAPGPDGELTKVNPGPREISGVLIGV
jgi:hypothetical protein